MSVRLHCRCQRGLVLAYIDGDSGDWVFVMCREYVEKLLGRELRTGERFTIDASIRETGRSEAVPDRDE